MTGSGKVTVEPLEFHLGLVTDSKGRACSDEAYITVGSDHGQEPTDHEINIRGPRANEIAALIAEAGTVYSETGLTPRQLADERERLREAIRDALIQIDDGPNDCSGTMNNGTRVWKGSFLRRVENLRTALTSSGRAPEGKQDGEDRP